MKEYKKITNKNTFGDFNKYPVINSIIGLLFVGSGMNST